MLNIKLTQDAYLTNNGEDYHDYLDDNGNLTEDGAMKGVAYYTAHAIDNSGNEYDVNWNISNLDAFNSGDEDCCNWDEPDEIYDCSTGKSVEANIIW